MDMVKKVVHLILIALLLYGCSPENFGEVSTEEPPSNPQSKGLFVLNEGLFGHGDGEITFINETTGETSQNYFQQVNGYAPGDIVFDAIMISSYIVLSVNNSNAVYILDKQWKVFRKIKLIQPRWILPAGNKVFISSLYRPYIYIIDLTKQMLVDSIFVHRPLEQLIWIKDKIWGIHWSSLASSLPNKYIMIVDTSAHKPIDSIAIGKEPNSIVFDKDESVWVLCGGGYDQAEAPTLWRINPLSLQVLQVYHFTQGVDYPSSLTINTFGDTLFFINKHVYSMPVNSSTLPTTPLYTTTSDVFYSLIYDDKYHTLWICNAKDYLHDGQILEINHHGQLLRSFPTGKIPRKVLRIS